MIVAEITKDYLNERGDFDPTVVGKQFDYEEMLNWWGWGDLPDREYWRNLKDSEVTTGFKLYDDDNELYYEGWLINDDGCIVQQFVLSWAKYDSGCTTIMIHKKVGYVQEIG